MQLHLSMNTNQKTDDWLIKNAIGCWLHHFPNHPWTPRYQELVKLDTYLPKTKVQGRRPQAKATGNKSLNKSDNERQHCAAYLTNFIHNHGLEVTLDATTRKPKA